MLKLYRNASLGTKLRLPLLLMLLLVIIQSMMSYFSLKNVRDMARYQDQVNFKSIILLLTADRDFYQSQVGLLSFINARQSSAPKKMLDVLREDYEKNFEQTQERFSNVVELLNRPEFAQNLKQFQAISQDWKKLQDEMLQGTSEAEIKALLEKNFLKSTIAFKQARAELDIVGDTVTQEAKDKTEEINQVARNTIVQQMTMSIFVVVIMLSMAWFIPRMIAKPARNLSDNLLEVAQGEGDLTQRLEIVSKDELGQVAQGYNQLMDKLQSSISQVSEAGDGLKESLDLLNELSTTNKNLAVEQRDAIVMIATAVEQMDAAIKQVASNAELVSGNTNAIADQSEQGFEIIQASSSKVKNLAGNMQASVEVINTLEQEALSIASVMDVIRGIAEQTNLLALNAAIEAARAGEQGRGFAVVADEVRSLAGRTQQSTQDIQKMIERLQTGVNRAVSSIQEGNVQVEQTVQNVENAKQSFDTIRDAIRDVSNMMNHIAISAEEQSSVVGGISENLSDIDGKAKRTTENSNRVNEQMRVAVKRIDVLSGVVSKFKI